MSFRQYRGEGMNLEKALAIAMHQNKDQFETKDDEIAFEKGFRIGFIKGMQKKVKQ